MLSVIVIGLAGITLGSIAFFVWCWFDFTNNSEPHPIYKPKLFSTAITESSEHDAARE